MPTIQRGAATIYYEEHGSGFPLLLLAPGGLNSTVDFWSRMPLNPLAAFSADGFRVIAMDQRNAGRSSGPLETADPWTMYADDQLAVLDHLLHGMGLRATIEVGKGTLSEDELTHEQFINAYLISKGADPVNLDGFRTLPSSKATGAQQIGRLTNLMQLTVDTTWWTRYRSRTKNPDLHDTFAPATRSPPPSSSHVMTIAVFPVFQSDDAWIAVTRSRT